MPSLAFLNAPYLFGLFLLAIPLALHLIVRKHVREVLFSDLRFLKQALVRRQRRLKLENRRLLILRMLLFLLMVAAMAKPVLKVARTRLVKENDNSTSIIILDNSFSMSAIENSVARFTRARQMALEILQGLQDEDRVTLILASGKSQVVLRNLPAAHSTCREAIESAKAGNWTSDLSQGLNLARQVLEESETAHNEVYLITDLQKAAFANVTPTIVEEAEPVDLYLLTAGFEQTSNVALTELSMEPPALVPGAQIRLKVEGHAYGDAVPGFASVSIHTPQRGLTETSVAVRPKSDFTQAFTESAPRSGYWLAEARVEDNVLPVDNQRYIAAPVEKPGRALLIEGQPRSYKRDWETFYFERALAIYSGSAIGNRPWEIFLQGVEDELSQIETGEFDLIVLANVPSVSPSAARRLENYLRRGGRLIVALGSRVDTKSYNQRMVPRILPGRLEKLVEMGQRPPYRITSYLDSKPPLDTFSGAKQGDLTRTLFMKYFALTPLSSVDTEILCRYETGDPAFIARRVGEGKVILWTSSLDGEWNDFPLRPLYLPFWSEILTWMEKSARQLPVYLAGDTVEINIRFGSSAKGLVPVRILMPDDSIESFEADPSAGAFRAFFSNTAQPGIYRVLDPPGEGVEGINPAVFAVNVSSRESDLLMADRSEISQRLADWKLQQIEQPRQAARILARARKGLPLWDIFLVLVFVSIIMETVYANRVWR